MNRIDERERKKHRFRYLYRSEERILQLFSFSWTSACSRPYGQLLYESVVQERVVETEECGPKRNRIKTGVGKSNQCSSVELKCEKRISFFPTIIWGFQFSAARGWLVTACSCITIRYISVFKYSAHVHVGPCCRVELKLRIKSKPRLGNTGAAHYVI